MPILLNVDMIKMIDLAYKALGMTNSATNFWWHQNYDWIVVMM